MWVLAEPCWARTCSDPRRCRLPGLSAAPHDTRVFLVSTCSEGARPAGCQAARHTASRPTAAPALPLRHTREQVAPLPEGAGEAGLRHSPLSVSAIVGSETAGVVVRPSSKNQFLRWEFGAAPVLGAGPTCDS